MKKNKLRVALMSALVALGGTSLVLGTLVSCGETATEKYTVTYTASDDYTISIASGTEYAEGDTVSFTVTVADGKTLTDVTANDNSLGSGGSYSFTMPGSDVVIVVTVTDTYTFVASADGTWGTGETLTISATVNATPISDFTIEATTGSSLVTVDNSAKTVLLNAAGDLVLTVTASYNGVTLTDTISGTITELDYSISQITSTGSYIIRGTVVAKNTRAYLVYDGTAGIYIYDSSGVSSVSVGNYVQVSGTVTTYHEIYQFESPTTTVLSNDTTTYTATELTADLVNYAASSSNDNAVTNVGYYTWTTTVGNAGGYTTLNLDGTAVNIEPMYVDEDEFTLVEGSTYTVSAWYYGYDKTYDYVSVILSSAELLTGGIVVTAAGDATTVGVRETLQLSAEYETGGTVTNVTWSSSDTGVATVSTDGLVTGVSAGSVVITATDTNDSSYYGSIALTVYNTSATWHENATLTDVAANTNYDGYDVYEVKGVQVSYITSSYYGQINITDGTTTIELWNSNYSTEIASLVQQSDGSYSYVYSNGTTLNNLSDFVVGVSVDIYIIGQTSGYYTNYYGCIVSYSQVAPESVSITQGTSLNLDKGESRTLTVTTDPELVSVTPTWSSDASSIVSVTDEGVVTGLATGTANVTVSYSNSVSASIAITVSDQDYAQEEALGTYTYNLQTAYYSESGSSPYATSLSTSTALTAINDVTDTTATNSLITSVDSVSRVYVHGTVGENQSPFKFSAANNIGSITFTTSSAVSKAVLTLVAWGTDSPVVDVNGTTQNVDSDGTGLVEKQYTFEFTSAYSITIGSSSTKSSSNRFGLTAMAFYA